MLAGVSVILILLSLSLVPVRISFSLEADLTAFAGKYRLTLFSKLIVYRGEFFIENDDGMRSLCFRRGNKVQSVHLTMNKSDEYSFANFLASDFIPPMDVGVLDVNVCFGTAYGAFASAILAAGVRSFISVCSSIAFARYNIGIRGCVVPSFSINDVFNVKLQAEVGVSFADIVYTLVKYPIKKLTKVISNIKKKSRSENV